MTFYFARFKLHDSPALRAKRIQTPVRSACFKLFELGNLLRREIITSFWLSKEQVDLDHLLEGFFKVPSLVREDP